MSSAVASAVIGACVWSSLFLIAPNLHFLRLYAAAALLIVAILTSAKYVS